jgi:hypothetical protein
MTVIQDPAGPDFNTHLIVTQIKQIDTTPIRR